MKWMEYYNKETLDSRSQCLLLSSSLLIISSHYPGETEIVQLMEKSSSRLSVCSPLSRHLGQNVIIK